MIRLDTCGAETRRPKVGVTEHEDSNLAVLQGIGRTDDEYQAELCAMQTIRDALLLRLCEEQLKI